jgi:hypothetical protein
VLGQPSIDRFLKPETLDIKEVPENTTGQLKIDVTLLAASPFPVQSPFPVLKTVNRCSSLCTGKLLNRPFPEAPSPRKTGDISDVPFPLP